MLKNILFLIRQSKFILSIIYVLLINFHAPFIVAQEVIESEENEKILEFISEWVHGRYNTSAQVDRDIENQVPDNEQHRLMYQLFKKVEVSFLDGVVIYQQSSIDGSDDPDWITRKGLLYFFVSSETGMVHQRELDFKDPDKYYNIHINPGLLENLTIDDFVWREGCDFKLRLDGDLKAVSGPMNFGSCKMENPGSGKDMVAEDKIRITPNEYWFLGRYLDLDGNIVWGTESDEMNKLVRVGDL